MVFIKGLQNKGLIAFKKRIFKKVRKLQWFQTAYYTLTKEDWIAKNALKKNVANIEVLFVVLMKNQIKWQLPVYY